VDAATDRVEHVIDVGSVNGYAENFEFAQALSIPSGSLGWVGLAPGHVAGSEPSQFRYANILYSSPQRIDFSGWQSMNGTVATYSVDILDPTSPVPEPGAYAMLAVGVAALGRRRRAGRG
jgi:hypothetical protein